jgi:carbon-monoxide dehydrogenase medium subunit
VLARRAAAALAGAQPTLESIRAAAAHDADPSSDIHASARYRRHLVEVLTRRVVTRAADRARSGTEAGRA